ncbi:MAG: Ribosome-recycling factor [Candidatus Gottesmanbacteria bacterium GW2011_GWA2_41_12]|nr:MAG: Ribosome-recycling factor [Candidatus Gottesmanbacteria bacterium GW2011_GWA2_41_12]
MQKALASLQQDLSTIRTGRASPALVENLVIPAYNNTQFLKLQEMATITTDGPRMIIISPFDPSVIRDIEHGINSANLGYTASPDSSILRINLPSLTEERRNEYIKMAHTKIEGGKVMVRQVRHEAMNDVKLKFEAKGMSEDEKKMLEKKIQDLTDEIIAEIEMLGEKKEEELRQI